MDLPEENDLIFASRRLRFRGLALTDAPALAQIGGQPGVARMLKSLPHPWPEGHRADWIEKARWTGALPVRLAVCLPDGQLIGTVGAGGDPLEIGYFIDPALAGQGYATEAAGAVIGWLFERFAPDVIVAEHFDDNPASAKVLRKLGFAVTGQGVGQSGARPAPAPVTLYQLTRMAFARQFDMRHATPPIITARLILRAMTAADAPAFHALVTRPEVARMLFIFPTDWPLSAAAPFLNDVRWQGRLRFRLAIEVGGVWAGWIGCSGDAEPEVFYALQPEFAGRGIAQEALTAFVGFLFNHFAPDALRAAVFTDNPASARVLEACGFCRVGVDMQGSAGRETPTPGWLYRLARADFKKLA